MKDKEVAKIIQKEMVRQKRSISLIASENYVSKDVEEALASVFGNKYSEGYPGKRYYKGQENTDVIELLCQKRALNVFGLSPKKWSVNVQALSGSPMNTAVYFALLEPGDTIMGMSLESGGHLTHGHKVSISGKHFTSVQYGVDPKTHTINYEELLDLAKKHKPKIIVAGFTAYPRKVDFEKFRQIADSIGAYLLCDISHVAGLIAGRAYPSPFIYADVVTTTTHKTLRGPRGALIFSKIDGRNLPSKIDKAVFPGIQGGPHMNTIAAITVSLGEAMLPSFKTYTRQVIRNAKAMSDEFKKHGYRVISGGTDSHLVLIDVWNNGTGATGKEAADALGQVGIITNQNTIPGDTRNPFDPSGLRLGTAAETTRGWKEKDFIECVQKIDRVLKKIRR